MLKELRLKFIALNMLVVVLVLSLAFISICQLERQREQQRVYDTLERAVEQEERFGSSFFDDSKPPQIGGRERSPQDLTPVALYLFVDESSEIVSLSTARTDAEISAHLLEKTVAQALENEENSGFLRDAGVFFAKRPSPQGVYLAFADVESASSWKTLALTLTGVEFAVIVGFFIISLFFSRWALKPVEHAWEQQQQFVADASHELKTPLTVILANTAIVKGKPDSLVSSQSQWIDSTQLEAERMQGLVHDMLELARPESQKARAEMSPVDLSDLVETETLQFESVAFERGLELESSISADLQVSGQIARLQRMVTTLIDNACKYAGLGSKVIVSLDRDGRQSILTVRNTGAVIDPVDLPHVFDRFYRADKARTSEGYGLGLAIAREIAQEHGGEIAVTSSEAHGTSFTVTLPLIGKR